MVSSSFSCFAPWRCTKIASAHDHPRFMAERSCMASTSARKRNGEPAWRSSRRGRGAGEHLRLAKGQVGRVYVFTGSGPVFRDKVRPHRVTNENEPKKVNQRRTPLAIASPCLVHPHLYLLDCHSDIRSSPAALSPTPDNQRPVTCRRPKSHRTSQLGDQQLPVGLPMLH
ncbi:hypothetical protein Micbo1qcDRAFT_49640 [Microdochium bolleyi]|uniref:Uncharacterized protein n=1 Tax=Microdochium bolleyi TaxID=196109 RepID=A0A136J5V1_9PEZI|nr:hypothetical protein Micbo1qcDRAFT_49640 [Microdochium bolleyi]